MSERGLLRGAAAWSSVLLLTLVHLAASQSGTQMVKQIRLTGGRGAHEGNVEVEVDGVWGYVCDDDFGFEEADVLCQDLGYKAAETFTWNNHFGSNTAAWRRSSVKFWLSGVNCSSASSLRECSSRSLGQHDCGPTEVAGVSCRLAGARCDAELFPCTSGDSCLDRDSVCDSVLDCTDGSDEAEELCQDVGVTRLVSNLATNIPGAALGTIFIKRSGEWGTLCDDAFTENDAKVICRSIGYEGGWVVPFMKAYLGQGGEATEILLEAAGCQGDEAWIGQCPSTEFGPHNCIHTEDAAAFCYDGGMEVRLAGGRGRSAGTVEVRLGGNKRWGNLCATRFDDFDAQVVCRMLGYQGEAQAQRETQRTTETVWQMHLDCLGREGDLQKCRLRFSNNTCHVPAAVTCSNSIGEVDAALQALLPQDCGEPEDAVEQFLFRRAKVRSGTISTRFDTPWLVSLRLQQPGAAQAGALHCGGTIISEFFVVTAAHCLDLLGRLNLVVRVGDYDSDYRENTEEEYFIDKIWEHEEHDILSFNDNDIALLKIEPKNGQGIRFGPRVKPLCLPRLADPYEDLQDCSITGWGPTFLNGANVRRPIMGRVAIRSDYECEEAFTGGANNYTSSFVCAGNLVTNVNSCKGDSGGPLTCNTRGGRKTLYGIVSSGFTCNPVSAPDNFTRVTKYLRWIYSKLSGSG